MKTIYFFFLKELFQRSIWFVFCFVTGNGKRGNIAEESLVLNGGHKPAEGKAKSNVVGMRKGEKREK